MSDSRPEITFRAEGPYVLAELTFHGHVTSECRLSKQEAFALQCQLCAAMSQVEDVKPVVVTRIACPESNALIADPRIQWANELPPSAPKMEEPKFLTPWTGLYNVATGGQVQAIADRLLGKEKPVEHMSGIERGNEIVIKEEPKSWRDRAIKEPML